MYHKKTQSWVKHIDFIFLDLLSLFVAYVLAFISRHGFTNPFEIRDYVTLLFVFALVDIIVLLVNNTFRE